MISKNAAKAIADAVKAKTAPALTAAPTCDRFGRPCLAVPLTGRDGAGRFALVDEDGLRMLRQAGARALFVVNDGQGREYVTFVRSSPRNRAMTAARAIVGDPEARRIEYRNGDRLDLRKSNLHIRQYAGVGTGRATRRAA